MKHRLNNNSAFPRRTFWFVISLTLAILAGGFGRPTAAQPIAPQSADAAKVKSRSGLDLIDDEIWSKAQQKFDKYTFNYQDEKNLDAALYKLAYSDKYIQAETAINQLLNKYDDFIWKGEAMALMAQEPGGVGPMPPRPAPAPKPEPGDGFGKGIGKGIGKGVGRGIENDDQAEDDPCEFKIAVLQGLFRADPQRGISVATDWLKPGSTQTVTCRGYALSLLARNGGKAATPVILGVARNEPDLKLRAKAISLLGSSNDESVIDPLREFALNTQQEEISEAALYALSQHSSERAIGVLGEIATSSKPLSLRRAAISAISSRPGEPAVDVLLKIYDTDQNLEIRKSVINGLSRRKSERAGKKLLEIAQSSDNVELRKYAINAIARRSGDQAIEIILGLYANEKNEDLKYQMLESLCGSNDPRVVHALIDAAKNPATPLERRKRAIGCLSRSKDPEVLKFLEDLLKQ
jgi:HEAT repeat protein